MQKLFTRKFTFVSLAFFSCFILLSSSGGIGGAYTGHPNDFGTCANCHSGGNGGAGVFLSGMPTTYAVGQTYPLTLTVTDADALAAGFQILAAASGSNNTQIGTFSVPAGTELTGARLQHSTPLAITGGEAVWEFDWIAPSTGAPAAVTFYFAGNAVNLAAGNGGDDPVSSVSAAVPLPINLTKLEAMRLDRGEVELKWQTAAEHGASHFVVMRSRDNQNFEPIGSVAAKGETTSTQYYTFIDRTATGASSLYYRLEQHDINGEAQNSRSIAVRINPSVIVVFADGNLLDRRIQNLRFTVQSNAGATQARLFNGAGQLISEAAIQEQNEVNIPMEASGMLFLQIVDAQGNILKIERISRF
jgi:hypothetical protein